MKTKCYNFLVNRQPGISKRYHQFHDGSHGIKKMVSWAYLLWLNFAYYVLCMHFLGKMVEVSIYEDKKLLCNQSESSLAQEQIGTSETFTEQLSDYDVVSFDIFDTLIFRPFSEPADLFFFLGEKLDVMNFKELRQRMEKKAREQCRLEKGNYEVTLEDIWHQMELETGISAETGMQAEMELEKKFCYANPFMLEVFRKLQERGKKIIIVSDMYLPKNVLEDILKTNGFYGFEKMYVSCEYGKSKAGGTLFGLVRKEYPGSMVHVGDNFHSDVIMAKKSGLAVLHYPNGNQQGKKYRSWDMSPIIGGAYRGLVNNYLYAGYRKLSMEQEYGFIYGGLFVTGYCAFIHEYCRKNQVERILFLSRDGDILKQAYEILYPEEQTEYAYCSRRVATRLMAGEDKYDFYCRFLYHKVNHGISLEKILTSMELPDLLDELPKQLNKSTVLSSGNVERVRKFLDANWSRVLSCYAEEQKAAKEYYKALLGDCKKAVAVDIGWAGSGAIALNHLAQKVWDLSCEIVGLIAGTNTVYNVEPNAGETFLQSQKLVAYLYSQSFNRDLMKKHNPNRNYNIYWELLLASPTPQFRGFCIGDNNPWDLVFETPDDNLEGIRDIQKGILMFVKEYRNHFADIPYMFNISGRDAYAPMLVAASKNEKYLKEITKRFAVEKNVG